MRDVAVVIVQNSGNQIYVHQRADNKKRFPGFFGLGAGGKIDSGEDAKIAAIVYNL